MLDGVDEIFNIQCERIRMIRRLLLQDNYGKDGGPQNGSPSHPETGQGTNWLHYSPILSRVLNLLLQPQSISVPLSSTACFNHLKNNILQKNRIYSWSAHCNDRHYHQIASSFSRRLHSSVAFEGWWGTFRLWALLCWRSCIDICRYQEYQLCQRREWCTLWRSRFCNWLQDCRRFVLEFLFWLSRQVRTDWHFLLLAKNLYGSACCCKADVCDLVDEFFYFTAVVGLFLMSLF